MPALYLAGALFNTAYPDWGYPLFSSILPEYPETGHVHITHNSSLVIRIAFNTNYPRDVTYNTSRPLTVAAENILLTIEIGTNKTDRLLRD
jgi:hypothetical protein